MRVVVLTVGDRLCTLRLDEVTQFGDSGKGLFQEGGEFLDLGGLGTSRDFARIDTRIECGRGREHRRRRKLFCCRDPIGEPVEPDFGCVER